MADLRELTRGARDRWRLTPWWGQVLIVYGTTRILTTLILLRFAELQGEANGTSTPDYFTFAANWDGQWYWLIAQQGYPAELPLTAAGHVDTNAWAFMPVFPFVTAAFGTVGVPFPVAGVLISLAAGAAAVLLFHMLMRESGLDQSQALMAVALLCVAPVSPLFQLAYAESLGLALLFLALLLVMRRRFWLLIPVILVASFTRPTGLAFAAFLFLYVVMRIVRRVKDPREHPLPPREFVAIVVAGLTSFAAGFAWAGIAWAATGSMTAYTDTELAWRAGYVGYGDLVPFQGWLQGLEFWLRFAGVPGDGSWALAVLAFVLVIAAFAAFLLLPITRRLAIELRLWLVGFALYLTAVFFPQSSTWRLLLPLAPALGAFAVPRSRVLRILLLVGGIVLQIVWIDWCWWRSPGDWSPP
jgi:hypothetical protein